MEKRSDLSRPLLDRAIEAIKSGQEEKAISLVQQMNQENQLMHDTLTDMVEMSLTFIANKLGEEAVPEAWQYLAKDFFDPMFESFKHLDHEQIVNIYSMAYRAHFSDWYIEDDEEKTVFVIKDCGGGGKLRKEGKLDYSDRHPMNGGATKKAYKWSADKKGVPYYCIHGPVWFDFKQEDWRGDLLGFQYGRQFDDDGNPIDEPCRITIYKRGKA
jgi:hypothetical protein